MPFKEKKMKSYEDIKKEDLKRLDERRKTLQDLIEEEFPGATISLSPDEPWRIKVEIDAPRVAVIILQPNRPLMTDVDNNFERIFQHAVDYARQILDNPPLKSINQGKIFLSNEGVTFEPYKG
jgi:hypothetical protein